MISTGGTSAFNLSVDSGNQAFMKRAEDAVVGDIPLRSNRFFSAEGQWFFATREGSPMGPFDDKREAQQGLDDFIEFMSLAEPKTLSQLHSALTPVTVV